MYLEVGSWNSVTPIRIQNCINIAPVYAAAVKRKKEGTKIEMNAWLRKKWQLEKKPERKNWEN